MSRFMTKLRIERVEDQSRDGRGTWRLIDPLAYESDVAQTIFVVPADFITDLASVPRLPFTYLLTGGIGHAAAVVHDMLYTTQEVPRAMADAVFKEALAVLGVPGYQSWLMWAGVRIGGGGSWDSPGPEQPDYVARQLSP